MINVGLLKFPLLAGVALLLLVSMWAGLVRQGWVMPAPAPGTVFGHGPLMIGGVLGTLITLERVVALAAHRRNSGIAFVAPLLTAVGGALLVLGEVSVLPRLLITAGSAGLVLIFLLLIRRHIATYTLVMTAGAVCWLIGNLLWTAGQPVFQVVHWWIAYLVLTIVGERLELSRIARLTDAMQRQFLLAAAVYLAGVVLTVVQLDWGVRLSGVGALALAAWLLRYDIARRTIKRDGITRYVAACLLSGYVWFGVGGVFALVFGGVRAGVQYELLLHALLLGFVFAMIFGHALIIIPSLTGRSPGYSPIFYAPLALLHLSLVLRIAGGLAGSTSLRQWGGMFNVIAILLFMGVMLTHTVRPILRERRAAV
ncbi:MAG: hypothetical protein HZC41_00575 [Chloroflexi bacterium]|nr:hypothetical protein [Chloroflexota bacterium]